MVKLRPFAVLTALLFVSAILLPVQFVARVSAAAVVTSYHFPFPVAPAGSLGPGQSVSFKVAVMSGRSPDPGGAVYLYYTSPQIGDTTTVPGAQCGGVTQVSTSASSPTLCAADARGRLLLTFTVAAQPLAQGAVTFVAENQPTSPTVTANTHYVFCTIYRFSASPIAPSGSRQPGASVPVTLTADNGLDAGVPNSLVFLSFKQTSGGGSASVGATALTSTPALFQSDGSGVVRITYTAPAVLPLSGQDSIVVQDTLSAPTEVNSDTYAFAAATPVISTGDVTTTEGDHKPGIPAEFTITVSPVQATPVTVQYTTMCGVGDQGCETVMPDDFQPVLTPVTVTIPANTSSTTIDVEQFSYTGHGGEKYNEGWFVKLQNPSKGVLGRSVGEGLLLPDVEATPAVLPYLYTGGAGVVPTTDAAGQPLYFSVTLGGLQTTAVTFNYATADGTAIAGVDYTAVSGTATIAAGKTSAIIVVTVLANSPPASNRTFTLTISNASGGLTISRPTGTGTILAS
jgi:Calx-beta domain